ncbi:MAG: hypothetical protein A2Y75_03745 [Candidatus Solincola sediminis]|uniref:Uncharacterized protein n=1 Tax=Candidatus Solincola sediminis TaxID=1797199 RepID=A0A1F2WHK8_9ACTN|nr:MAG: hypothetical protein A2Y75_03745 [Candidatus Solincola sediminis]
MVRKEWESLKKRLIMFLAVLLFISSGIAFLAGTSSKPASADVKADAVSGASPNYRTFKEHELKSIRNVAGGVEGGHYTCSKNSDPFTYFEQDWSGVGLSYLLEQEVGIKADTTAIKIIADDNYSVTLTLDEMRGNSNARGLKTILAYLKGAQSADNPNAPNPIGAPWVAPVAADQTLTDSEGPFRLVIPQQVEGPDPRNTVYSPAGTGTPNWNKAVQRVRAIEVQPTSTGVPPIDPASIPAGELVVYGNILNRHTFTVDQLKSIEPFTGTYHWKNKSAVEGDSVCTGLQLDYLIDEVLGTQAGATDVKLIASDAYSKSFTMNEVRAANANGLKMLLAWYIDADLTADGPIESVKPQADAAETNKSKWIRNLRVIEVDPIGTDPVPDATLIPSDRIIVCGKADAGNVPNEWYLAEGCTGFGFEEWILIGNPNSWKTHVLIDYMIEGAAVQTQELEVDPRSRTSIRVNSVIGDGKNVSARVEGYHGDSLLVERAMYWNNKQGGHCASGVTSLSNQWYLAEGCTAGGFETWVLLQNPGDTAANVNITYMNKDGEKAGPALSLPAKSRTTINAASTMGSDWNVSTKIDSDQPIIAERAMYWNDKRAGHDGTGVSSLSNQWYLAEGCTAGGFETWVLLQNPGDAAANVNITYMNADGVKAGPTVTLPAKSRTTINAADIMGNDWNVSTKIDSDQPIIAERAMYWDNTASGKGGGHCENGVTHGKFRSFLAEGCTAGGFETWALFQNPGNMDATVYITYLTGDGAVEREPLLVPAGKRVSISEKNDIGETYDVSFQATSTAPVVIERAVYWNNKLDGSCSQGLAAW